ncbi:MAG: hypothetical protein H6765_07880 [Candidatus Peribacteria bacterium]|nr:MAG: hypothetical protein H6765_07880 [Candidatus Peribacteria bacterium]
MGREAVADYYVKPINKVFTSIAFIDPKHIDKGEVDDLHILDQKLAKIGKVLNMSRILKPENYLDELDNFLTRN